MKILICIDGILCIDSIIQLGGSFARFLNASVTLLHIVDRKREPSSAQQALAQAREMLPGLKVETLVQQGDPAEKILEEIRGREYDLAVIGACRETLSQRLLGSVAQQVIPRAPISLLIARDPPSGLKRFLVCTGGLDVAISVIETAAWLAGAAGAHVSLLHIITPVPSMYTGLADITESLSELLQTDTPVARHLRSGAEILARYQVPAELKLHYGVVADEILRESEEGDYDLVVIGASGTAGRLKGLLLGDVTRQVVDRTSRSMLIIQPSLPLHPPTPPDDETEEDEGG